MTVKQQEQFEAYLEARRQANVAKKKQLLVNLVNQVTLLEGKKGKGKTLAAVAIVKSVRELYDKPVVIIGSKMGLTEEFGDYTFLDEKQFVNELDSVAKISKSTPDEAVQGAVEKALRNLGVNIYNAVLVFDEAYKLFDARTPSDKLVRVFGYFVAQSRHYGITIVLISPHRDMIDKRVRRQADWYGRCSTTCKSLPDPETGKPVCVRPQCPHRTTVRFIGGATRFKLSMYGPDYWPLYDTWSLVGFRQSHLNKINI